MAGWNQPREQTENSPKVNKTKAKSPGWELSYWWRSTPGSVTLTAPNVKDFLMFDTVMENSTSNARNIQFIGTTARGNLATTCRRRGNGEGGGCYLLRTGEMLHTGSLRAGGGGRVVAA